MSSSLLSPVAEDSSGPQTERYYRIYRIDAKGEETVLRACLPEVMAQSFVTGYNATAPLRGFRAEAREIDVSGAPLAGTPRWRVEIVCDSTGDRQRWLETEDESHAIEMADWFGRDGDVRAEISEIKPGDARSSSRHHVFVTGDFCLVKEGAA